MPFSAPSLTVRLSVVVAAALVMAGRGDESPGRQPGVPEFTGFGDTDCPWGSRDCNRCVEDVEGQIASMGSREPTGRFTFWLGTGSSLRGLDGPMDPIQQVGGGHVQGFARIPAFEGDNWFVISRSNDAGRPAGLVIAKMDDITGRAGDRLVPPWTGRDVYWMENPPPAGSAPPDERASRSFLHIPETRHPGGIQAIGRMVAVPSYCRGGNGDCRGPEGKKRAFVDFWEMRLCDEDPSAVCPVRAANRLLLPREGLGGVFGLFGGTPRKAFYLAIARLDTGHYVLFVNRGDRGEFDVFVSSNQTIDMSTEWVNHRRVKFGENFPNAGWGNAFSKEVYQNMNFVTDCESEKLYALGLRQNGWDGRNSLGVFRAEADETGALDLIRLGRIHPRELDDSCEMKGGANVYVTRRGELILYCSQGKTWVKGGRDQDERFLSFSEHTSIPYPPCPDTVESRRPCAPSDVGTTLGATFSFGNDEGERIEAPALSGNALTFVSVLDYRTQGDDDFAYRISDAGGGEYFVWTRYGDGSTRLRIRLQTVRLPDLVETERRTMTILGSEFGPTRSLFIREGNAGVLLVETLEYDPHGDDDFEYAVEVAEPVTTSSGDIRIDITGLGRFAKGAARATFRLTLLQWPETEPFEIHRGSLEARGDEGLVTTDLEPADLVFTAPTGYLTDRDDDLAYRTGVLTSAGGAMVESEATHAGSSASLVRSYWTIAF